MFLGYAKGHAGDVYRMLNLKTRKVIISRDVQWMGAGKNEAKTVRFNEEDDDDDGETVEAMEFDDEDEEIEEEEHQNQAPDTTQAPTPKPRLINEVKGLKMYNNPGRLDLEEGNLFCFFVGAENKEKKTQEPTSFSDAWNHEDPSQKSKWRDAIRLEFNQMLKNGVWNRKGEDKLPANRKGFGTKWVFKIKKDGTYRARLVAKGYNQIAGVDFQHNFAPVTNEVTLRILLMTCIVKDLYAEVEMSKLHFWKETWKRNYF